MISSPRIHQCLMASAITVIAAIAATVATSPSANAAPVTAVDGGEACLPIAMPTADLLFKSPKRVFAHYIPTFPTSIDNKPSATDYYNVQYLNPIGEYDKWLAHGAFLRQRPTGVSVNNVAAWQQSNMEREVRMAIARGITAFAFDVMSLSVATDPAGSLQMMLAAAEAVDPRFKIMVMPDISALGSNSAAVISIIEAAAARHAAFRLSDGRLLVSAFNASQNSATWWESVFAQLAAKNIHVAFVPTFLGWQASAPTFASISYGFGSWGTATPAGEGSMVNDPTVALKTYGKIFMMPVDPQQFRPKDYMYWEAGNSAAYRSGWASAISGQSAWVQLVTWSDFSETSQVQPYTDATLRHDIGTGYYDLTGYYAAWFSSRVQPTITHDVLYYFYRREPSGAAGPKQSQLDYVVGGVAQDEIELLAFLTAPGVLKITIGGQTYTHDAPAGITSFKIPTQPGTPRFTLSRDEADVFSYDGGVQIYGHSGTPAGVIDMTYWSGSASKSGVCAL
ncbi:MAG TPA: glycoside hydrolase family 71 protein [Steroidobacteraceae bacterium]